METVDSTSPDYQHPADHVHEHVSAVPLMDGPGQVERCPTCERALPKPHTDAETRVRRGWTIAVPVDERENGADVLDSLLDECRKLFGHDTNRKVRYYTVAQALALVVQNQTQAGSR